MRKAPALAVLLLLFTTGCATLKSPERQGARGFTLLAINDVYRIEGADGGTVGGLARVRELRAELEREAPDLLVLHAGDLLFPSLPSRLYGGAQMIDVLNVLDGDADAFDDRLFLTFGNHEFDEDKLEEAEVVRTRVAESGFRWLDTNITWASGEDGRPVVAGEDLVKRAIVSSGGVEVGLFSITTDFKQPAYVVSYGDDYAEVARREVAALRSDGAEVVVALTHLSLSEDKALLERLGDDGPDLVIGGHDHNEIAERVAGRWILKAAAEAASATVARVELDPAGGLPRVTYEHRQLDATVSKDPDVDQRVTAWLSRFDREYCTGIGRQQGCLGEEVGRTRVELVGEELEIRRFETNLGNWLTDRALDAFADQGAQIAFFNSGSYRLNQEIPPGPIALEHIEGIFQYPSDLVLLEITGSLLQQVVDHAVTDWTGNGKWLQVSGFAFRHDPETGTADRLTYLGPGGPRRIEPDEVVLAVTNTYVATPGTGQDGYTMLTRDLWRSSEDGAPSLRALVLDALDAAGEEGIAPEVEGRICNTERGGPCLAVE